MPALRLLAAFIRNATTAFRQARIKRRQRRAHQRSWS